MKSFTMCILGAIPNRRIGQEFFYSFVLSISLLTLSGCVTSQNTASLAPQPPIANHYYIESDDTPLYAAHYFAPPQGVGVISQDEEVLSEQVPNVVQALGVESDGNTENRCRLKDRFDREALIAYEWDRNRMSLDVDGIGGGSDNSGVRFEYKIRLQPEKSSKQKCRYSAKWQGLLGSSYNELVLRKEDTVMEELKQKRGESLEFISSLF